MKIIIIAEAGVNHNGSMDNAFRLIDAAATAGVDYIKFQTFKANKLVSASAKKLIIKSKIPETLKKHSSRCCRNWNYHRSSMHSSSRTVRKRTFNSFLQLSI